MLDRIESSVNAHLHSGIRTGMHGALHTNPVTLIHSRIQLLLRKLRNITAVRGQKLNPIHTVADLFTNLLADRPRAVHLRDTVIMTMAAGHADTGIGMQDSGRRKVSLLRSPGGSAGTGYEAKKDHAPS